ncbi:hypothetical protein BH11CYA1_BH11CYA1_24970 [soil metagenome]
MIKLDPTKLWRALLVVLTIGTILCVADYFYFAPRINRGITSRILFHPPERSTNNPITINGILGKHHKITGPAKSEIILDSILFQVPKDKERGVILVSLGIGSSINYLCDPFQIATMLQQGFSVFIYDHVGYGLSSGQCNIDRMAPDGILAHDYLVDVLKYPAGSIVAYGESFGTGVTSELHKKRPLRAMILESPFTSPKGWADQQLSITQIYPDFLFIEPTFSNLDMIKGKHPPVLIIGTTLDKSVPINHARELASQAHQPFRYLELPNSQHVIIGKADRKIFCDELKQFLDQVTPVKQ